MGRAVREEGVKETARPGGNNESSDRQTFSGYRASGSRRTEGEAFANRREVSSDPGLLSRLLVSEVPGAVAPSDRVPKRAGRKLLQAFGRERRSAGGQLRLPDRSGCELSFSQRHGSR